MGRGASEGPYPIDSLLRHFGSFLFNRLNILII